MARDAVVWTRLPVVDPDGLVALEFPADDATADASGGPPDRGDHVPASSGSAI
jgi:hypothetical protein